MNPYRNVMDYPDRIGGAGRFRLPNCAVILALFTSAKAWRNARMTKVRAMMRASCAICVCVSAAAIAQEQVGAADLSAEQIVEKNVAARGGAQAWGKISSMAWVGHVESANATGPTLPFVLEMKRPNKTRFQITAQHKMAVHVFDGIQGWKLRSAEGRKPEVQASTPDEARYAKYEQVIDGPLIDHRVKGIVVSLDGVDQVEGHKAYRLNVTLLSGVSHHIWIDAQTFLEIKYDKASRNAKGLSTTVSVFYRNYHNFEGLQIPTVIETGGGSGGQGNKMVIEKIALNPVLEDWRFTKPGASALTVPGSAATGAEPASGATSRP